MIYKLTAMIVGEVIVSELQCHQKTKAIINQLIKPIRAFVQNKSTFQKSYYRPLGVKMC